MRGLVLGAVFVLLVAGVCATGARADAVAGDAGRGPGRVVGELRVPARPTGGLLVVPPWPGRAELIAVRGPVFVAAHDFADGTPWRVDGLPPGEYELLFPRQAERTVLPALVTVGAGSTTADLR